MVIKLFGKGLLKGLGITFKHTFEREITVQYPEQMPFLQNRFRGCLEFDFSKCIVCGLCTKACPNNVLKLETAAVEGSKKKKLMRYIIDLQYCMFCNLCVEACPHDCLRFNHNFELSQLNRDDISIVYDRPPELDQAADMQETTGNDMKPASSTDEAAAQAKRTKQMEAMKNALIKNPQKTLSKLIEQEEDIEILSALITADEKKLVKIAELMIDDREKAVKIAQAFVNKEKKDRNKEGGEPA
jgi:NADH-quinone oxidoreductase subunit I